LGRRAEKATNLQKFY
jgi:hypothetical protein